MRAALLALLSSVAVPATAQGRVAVDARIAPAAAAPGAGVTLEVAVTVEEGWHVYGSREKTGIPTELRIADAGGLEPAGPARVPEGTLKETSGSWILAGGFTVRQPLRVPAGAKPGRLTLKGSLATQACTDELCEPPAETEFSAVVTVQGAAAPQGAGPAEVSVEAPRLSGTARLEPSRAGPGQEVRLVLKLVPESGWHVYGRLQSEDLGTPTQLSIKEAQGLEPVGDPQVPPGTKHETGSLVTHWLEGPFEVSQRLRVAPGWTGAKAKVKGAVTFMACTPEICDMTTELTFEVEMEVGGPAAGGSAPPPAAGAVEPDVLGAEDGGGLLGFLLLAFGAGLFALVMPCTYPMIPITISFFTKQAEERGGRVLPLALLYGGGIVAMFVLIGVALGGPIQRIATHPVTNLVIAGLFVVFALSLFGVITLQPPRFLLDRAGRASSRGGYAGVFLMGATLVVTSFTCTAPFVGSLLSVGGGYGLTDVALGMLVFGLTMAAPFVLLSLVPGKLRALPRSGEWMNVVKVAFGFVELAAALKFLSNADLVWKWQALPRDLFLWLWAGIFGTAGAYLLGMIRLKDESGAIGPGRLVSGLGVLLFAIYCVFGALGNPLDSIMTAIAPNYVASAGTGDGKASKLAAKHVIVKDDHEAATARAIKERKLLLMNFTGFS
jgi:thiol:disulfide interchange protein DsbD